MHELVTTSAIEWQQQLTSKETFTKIHAWTDYRLPGIKTLNNLSERYICDAWAGPGLT